MSDALLLTCALVLGASGAFHMGHFRGTASAIARHGVLPQSLVRPVAVGLPAVELILTAGLALGSVLGLRHTALAFATGAAIAFLLFAAYLYAVWRRHPDAELPCACGLGTATVGGWVAMRALILALLAGAGAIGGGVRAITSRPLDEVVIIGAAALSLSIAVSALPDARATRAPTPLEGAS